MSDNLTINILGNKIEIPPPPAHLKFYLSEISVRHGKGYMTCFSLNTLEDKTVHELEQETLEQFSDKFSIEDVTSIVTREVSPARFFKAMLLARFAGEIRDYE